MSHLERVRRRGNEIVEGDMLASPISIGGILVEPNKPLSAKIASLIQKEYTSTAITILVEVQDIPSIAESREEVSTSTKQALRGLEQKDKELTDAATKKLISTIQVVNARDVLSSLALGGDDIVKHCTNVALFAACAWQGNKQWQEEFSLEAIVEAALLHDAGKIDVGADILNKKGPFTDEERQKVNLHPKFGYDRLREMGYGDETCIVALQHHEQDDGTGYPNKFKGNCLTKMAQIIHVIDVYEARTAPRVYKPRQHPEFVLDEMRKQAMEGKFNLPIFNQTMMALPLYRIGDNVMVGGSSEARGTVVENYIGAPRRPKLDIIDLKITPACFIQAIINEDNTLCTKESSELDERTRWKK